MTIGKGYFKEKNIGVIEIRANEKGITSVGFINDSFVRNDECETDIIKKCKVQLQEYFDLKRKKFNLPLSIDGTKFQKKVWNELLKIPYGETVSYKYIAEKIDNSKACRAVGGANNRNKIGIIIPCHRVIGKNGKLTGYASGVDIKEYLLKLEKRGCY